MIALTGKMPNVAVHRHGIKDALDMRSDAGAISKAFDHPATTGIGIATTFPLVVVDIDGEEGAASWKSLAGPNDFIPDRWVAQTGRGLHLYMGAPEPTGSRKLGPLLDLKGEGGYVAAPPSLHPDGHVYSWLADPDGPLLEAPAALAAWIKDANWESRRAATGSLHRKPIEHAFLEDGRFWASHGFEGLYGQMKRAEPGNRNNLLHWVAMTMLEEGAEDEDFATLADDAVKAGLTRDETRATIRSARRKVQHD